MNINWNEIKEKYPKSFYKIVDYHFNIELIDDLDNSNIFRDFCYCDIEEFFDSQNYIIVIDYNTDNNFCIDIYQNEYCLYSSYKILFENRIKAKEQAIYKAFEILEESL